MKAGFVKKRLDGCEANTEADVENGWQRKNVHQGAKFFFLTAATSRILVHRATLSSYGVFKPDNPFAILPHYLNVLTTLV